MKAFTPPNIPLNPRVQPQSEWMRLLYPLEALLVWMVKRTMLWMIGLGLLYLFSGWTIVEPDEVAVVYRWGSIRNQGSAQALVQPGLLMALPKPIDRVQRIPVQKVFEQSVEGLHFRAVGQMTFLQSSTLDPEKVGYALTGDGNVVHVSFRIHYQISDPVLYLTEIAQVEPMLDHLLRSVALQAIAMRTVDSILSDGREEMLRAISEQMEAQLERFPMGVSVVSVEMQDLVPPYQIKEEFNAVQTAVIEAQTEVQTAEEYRALELPKAQTRYNQEVSKAKSVATQTLATARAEASVFVQLATEAKLHPEVVYRRLLQDSMGEIGKEAGRIQFVPPPMGAKYPQNFRIVLEAE